MRKEVIYLFTEGATRSISKHNERDCAATRQSITNTIRRYGHRYTKQFFSYPFMFDYFFDYLGLVSSWYERSFEEVLRYEQMEPTTTNMER